MSIQNSKVGVVFDLDGTLIDSTDAIVQSVFETFDDIHEPRPERESVIACIGYVLEDKFVRLTKYDPQECVRIYRAHYARIARASTVVLPGVREALAKLRTERVPMGFATSKGREPSLVLLDHFALLPFFTARIGPEDVTRPKPDPEPILKAAAQLGLGPEAVIYVGDLPIDVVAAHAAGARSVCVTTGYATREALVAAGADAVFDDLLTAVKHILNTAPKA